MAKKAVAQTGRADLPVSQDARQRVPTTELKLSSILDTRVASIKLSLKSLIVFLIMASASLVGAQTLQTFFSFNGGNGYWPEAALTLGSDGNFYGTTYWGGSYNDGTMFKVTTNGTLTTLVSFNGGYQGEFPEAALTLGNDSNFYGTTCGWGLCSVCCFRRLSRRLWHCNFRQDVRS